MNSNILNNMDDWLNSRGGNDRLILFVAIVGIIGWLLYTFLYPVAEENLNRTKKELAQKNSELEKQINYLKSKGLYKVKNGQQVIRKLEDEILKIKEEYNEQLSYDVVLDKKLRELSQKFYNEKIWTILVDRLSSLAKLYNIDVGYIKSNKYNPPRAKVEKLVDFSMAVSGRFNDTISFINSIEQSSTMLHVEDINMTSQDSLNSNFKIVLWGFKY